MVLRLGHSVLLDSCSQILVQNFDNLSFLENKMAITLRTVGVFYRAEIDLGAGGGTVKDVMHAAMKNDPSVVTPLFPG